MKPVYRNVKSVMAQGWCWQSEFDRAKDPYSLAMAMARKGKDLTTGKVTFYSDETIF